MMSATPAARANRLIHETSPYLLQHARNPVDWHPWGEEAFEKARRENKPIFLSIGYSACHWCHVMERESFENEEIAAFLNEHFVSIKVDREERPDVDEIYMNAVVLMTGSGGWPMSVFLTPDLQPFYGGTYFPPEDRHGMPGFPTVLRAIIDVYKNQPDRVAQSVEVLGRALAASVGLRDRGAGADGAPARGDDLPGAEAVAAAAELFARNLDRRHGGFGGAPKFPNAPAIAVLLRLAARNVGQASRLSSADRSSNTDRRDACPTLTAATTTLDGMARGGMCDQLGGGFHRYSVDERWLVPHFEKMLYDNAQLASIYLDAWRLTGADEYRRVAVETLDYVLRDMTAPDGAFYSARDADSEGGEGAYYTWSRNEIRVALGDADAALFEQVYGVTAAGNFEGANILYLPQPLDEAAVVSGMSYVQLLERLAPMRARLLALRDQRPAPSRDEKILTDWNALMVSAFANGARALGDERYRSAAQRAGRFLLERLRAADGRLYHVFAANGGRGSNSSGGRVFQPATIAESPMVSDASPNSADEQAAGWKTRPPLPAGGAKIEGFLADYAYVLAALLDLYQTDFDPAWIAAAEQLAQLMLADFQDTTGDGGFFMTSGRDTRLIVRPKRWDDGSTPAAAAVATLSLLRLSELNGDAALRAAAEAALRGGAGLLRGAPHAFLSLALAADFAAAPPRQIAIVGPRDDAATRAMLALVATRYLPNAVVAFRDPAERAAPAAQPEPLALLAGRAAIGGRPTAYVCAGFACRLPVHTAEQLAAQLGL